MKSNYIYQHIRKSSIINILISLVILIIISVITYMMPFKAIYNPKEIALVHQASYAYANDIEYISITLNDVHYTGYDNYRNGKIVASYYYSLSNNLCTILLLRNPDRKLPEHLNNYSINARLEEFDGHSNQVIEKMAEDLNWTKDGLRSVTSDVMIDETGYKADLYQYLALSLFIFGIISVSYLISNFVYALIPAAHPSCIYFRRLSKDRKTIENVNHELHSKLILESGNTALTENYIVRTTLFNIEIIPITRIVWAYEHTKWHHFLWIKTRLSYTLSILYGHNIHIDSSGNTKEDIDTILEYLSENYPNMILGYTEENKAAAKKKCIMIARQDHLPKKNGRKKTNKNPFGRS